MLCLPKVIDPFHFRFEFKNLPLFAADEFTITYIVR